MRTYRKPNEQIFPNRWPLSYLNVTKDMKAYIRRPQHKKFKHQDIKQFEPPQTYRLGTISITKLLAGFKKVQVGKDQEKAQSEKRFPLQKPRWEKPN